jgi:hypothetical protein
VLTVPTPARKAPAVAAAAGAKPAAPAHRSLPLCQSPRPVDDDMYDIKEDAPPGEEKGWRRRARVAVGG